MHEKLRTDASPGIGCNGYDLTAETLRRDLIDESFVAYLDLHEAHGTIVRLRITGSPIISKTGWHRDALQLRFVHVSSRAVPLVLDHGPRRVFHTVIVPVLATRAYWVDSPCGPANRSRTRDHRYEGL